VSRSGGLEGRLPQGGTYNHPCSLRATTKQLGRNQILLKKLLWWALECKCKSEIHIMDNTLKENTTTYLITRRAQECILQTCRALGAHESGLVSGTDKNNMMPLRASVPVRLLWPTAKFEAKVQLTSCSLFNHIGWAKLLC
jgi:hypothetical protein